MRMRNNYFDKLLYLMVLAEEQNITHAADKLFLSQPALTAYINRLEEDLGVRLFDRSTTPIKLTPAGAHYIAEMEKIRLQQHQLFDDLKRMEYDPQMTLTIGIGRNRGSLWLPYILPAVYERFPEAHLRIDEDRDENMIEKLTRNSLDVAITESFIHNPLLNYRPLPDELYCLITGASNPQLKEADLRGNSRFNPLDVSAPFLNGELFICAPLRGGLNFYTSQLFTTYRITPREVIFISNLSTAYQLAVKGIGITYLAANYVDITRTKESPIFLMPGGKPAVRKVYAVYEDTHMTDLKQFFIDYAERIMLEVQQRQTGGASG